ncbi:uncharacterized protein ARMOST_19501 [Armillaria ostoyae]|uniref:Uncharacterized protein n=1 Tax=Armillaria ostoyae TaxID=47428 RepID=A0A284S4R5_ARMOS|nr:uncharacterized protein ARMOST_19501 [Armillaria ostoyae]
MLTSLNCPASVCTLHYRLKNAVMHKEYTSGLSYLECKFGIPDLSVRRTGNRACENLNNSWLGKYEEAVET